ncbi:hypothetical protein BDN72DRAFT_898574 [Pluteus cervinus]|uniref:Uncharacterized protein n=1 Tax=Pluteus cervinus TaxID=181527 RepID=A0ACD3AQI0_9AGAR|nr:hypothetical protein BDN72DRAFT_898574 [Pluteus cervinus]
MPPSSSQAAENNNKLFPYYLKKLSQSDPAIYNTFSSKLAIWLSSERAYYPAARPQIVNLLQTAYATLHQAIESNPNTSSHPQNSMTMSYIHLLETVQPFVPHFVEPHLQAHLHQLFATVRSLQRPQQSSPTFIDLTISSNSDATNDRQQIPPNSATQPNLSSPMVSYVEDGPEVGNTKTKKRKRRRDLTELVELDVTNFVQKQEDAMQAPPAEDGNVLILDKKEDFADNKLGATDPLTQLTQPLSLPISEPPFGHFEASTSISTSDLGPPLAEQPNFESESGSLSHNESTSQQLPGQMSNLGVTARVIAFQQGLPNSRKICIDFDISEAQFGALKAWISGYTPVNQQIGQYLCLSFACYDYIDLAQTKNKYPDLELEQLVGYLGSSWPNNSGLSISVHGTSVHKLSLAPPFTVTEDGFVDISQFISLGSNKIEVLQQFGMSKYVFALYAHHPTPGQVAAIQRQEHNERQWQEWLTNFQSPFDLSVESLITS